MDTTIGIYYSFLDWNQSNQDTRQPSKKSKRYQLLYTYGFTT